MEKTAAIILAAGDGRRMKSKKPKVLCEVLFRPMITWVTDACLSAGITHACVIIGGGEGGDAVKALLPEGFETARQHERRGTGHAAMMASDFLRSGGYTDVLVLNGDAPFIDPADIRRALEGHRKKKRSLTVLTARVPDPHGYGRIIRDGDGVSAIVEQSDADDATAAINEINSGAFWFDVKFLLEFFDNMKADNAQGEYYLTDSLSYAVETGKKAGAYIAVPDTALGANSRGQLTLLNETVRLKLLDAHRDNGVNIPFNDGVIIGADVKIATDTTILPGTILRGKTVVGEGCEIGPNAYLDNAIVGDGCRVISTYIDSSSLMDGVKIGPMSNVRPDCHIAARAKIGDFVELKNSNIGEATSVAHLTYVGDSDVGARCNFGCGVVTVNYDGIKKYRTTVGDDVFIGCNTNLVAPVKLGDRAYTAAGTTVTEDVPEDSLAIGRARQSTKPGWTKERRPEAGK